MVIVIGSPIALRFDAGVRAAGTAVAVARAVRAVGADVEIVGRVGEDSEAEAVLLDVAAARIGHVAVLRDPRTPTPRVANVDTELPPFAEKAADEAPDGTSPAAVALEAADVELALRYLPEYRVVVVADPLDEGALRAAADAARWAGAALVVVVAAGASPPAWLDPEATVLEAPAEDDGAFTQLVGEYAARLDRGEPAADAFAAASEAVGWTVAAHDA